MIKPIDIFEASQITAEALLRRYGTRPNGLSPEEARVRHRRWGKNALAEEARKNILFDFLYQLKNPLVLILLVASILSFFLGENLDGSIIAFIILLSTLLNLYQEKKADHAARKLRERLSNKIQVIRGGQVMDIKTEEVTMGDILDLSAGDMIPADGRVLSAKDFFVNQSALTGESFPGEKVAKSLRTAAKSINELANIVFSGTNVITGTATVLVTGIGKKTEFGKIAQTLSKKEQETEFTLGVKNFGNLLLRTTIIIVLAIFLINIILKRDLFESFLFAIAIAVGLTPELLPLILSVNMTMGAVRMAKEGVIVKKLVAIPNFGSMDVLCTDKTGTLTEDRIVLVKCIDRDRQESEKVHRYAYLNSLMQTGIVNPLDQAVMSFKKMDVADFKKIDEVPFDFLRKRMSVVVGRGIENTLICKGAPEELLAACALAEKGDGTVSLTKQSHESLLKIYQDLSAEGYRVLALGYKTVDAKTKVFRVADEQGLTFLGFIAFLDPPKADVSRIVEEIHRAGIKIKIITGDNEVVTQKVCHDLNITIEGIMLGHEIDGMTDDALRVAVEKNNIFARFSPDEKNRIISALRANGHVVGYMGDGINDAPSLKTADVGISVENAVDVAKESADIILTEKDLEVLLDGILAGRKIFANSMKYIMMGVSSNFGNMFSVIGAVIFLPFLPMLPIQILLNNLIYDFSQLTIPNDHVDAHYIEKPKRWNLPFVKRFMIVFGLISSLFDYLTFFLLYHVFHASAGEFQTGWFIESLATQTLIILVIRTSLIPFIQSNPAKSLLFSTILAVVVGWTLPFLGFGSFFGLVALRPAVLFSMAGVVVVYLVTVEVIKHVFYRYVQY